MDNMQQRDLAEQLVDLIVMNRITASELITDIHISRLRESQITLYTKHLEAEQLQALLCFYNTEIGKSILISQQRMAIESRQSSEAASESPLITDEDIRKISSFLKS